MKRIKVKDKINHLSFGKKADQQIISSRYGETIPNELSGRDLKQQIPFGSLYRDSDVENMSDGWDDDSVYGFVHSLPMADGHGALHSLRYETRNSGLFYLGRHATLAPSRASPASLPARTPQHAHRHPPCG